MRRDAEKADERSAFHEAQPEAKSAGRRLAALYVGAAGFGERGVCGGAPSES